VSQSQITGRKSIISMSLGGPGTSSAMDQAVYNAAQEGVLVVGTFVVVCCCYCFQCECASRTNDATTFLTVF
jgi:hypothetical protein